MTQVQPKPITYPAAAPRPKGARLLRMVGTTDPKDIAILYLVTSFGFFMVGGLMAMLMRAELAQPGLQFLSNEQYNQLFTMHGTIMLLLYATPILFGFANYIVPLQIGAPDVAFPRLNAFSYWAFLFGGLIVISGFLTPGGAADFGWFAYTPLSDAIHSPGFGADLWITGLILAGLGTILGGGQLHHHHRLPARPRHDDVPDAGLHAGPSSSPPSSSSSRSRCSPPPCSGCWPTATSARTCSTRPTAASILWQHLFWFFGHPEVYIVALPFFGIMSEVIPVFSRKPLFGYKGMIYALIAHRRAVRGGVGAPHVRHRRGAAGLLLPHHLPHRDPDRHQVRQLDRHHVERPDHVRDADAVRRAASSSRSSSAALTGVLLASPPIDFHVSDTYFVVAHFHYVLFGTIVFATYAGIYFWFPKMTGRMMDETLGKVHFWLTFIGFHTTFLVQHWLGNEGMPRRYADYLPSDGFTTLNVISTIGAFVLGASTLPFIWNVFRSYRYGRVVTVDDPWGFGNSLEWATSCPPPRHNFTELPRIRSERPAFDLHYPHLMEKHRQEAHLRARTHKTPRS